MSQVDLWYATRATGTTALVLLTATVVLGILVAGRARGSLPGFARAELHKRLSMVTAAFLAVHVVTSVVDTYVNIGWLAVVLPFASAYHPFWTALGAVGVDSFLAVGISSAARRWLPARLWRQLHWVAYLSWPSGVAHALGMGTDAKFAWVRALVGSCIAAVLGAIAWRAAGFVRSRAALPATAVDVRSSLRPAMQREAA